MKAELVEHLVKLEKEQGIRVIHVAECDSHAWGFAHDKSDRDVRFIYVQLPWAEVIQNRVNTFKVRDIENNLDIQGMELRAFISKIGQSSFNAYEILHSPCQLAEHAMYSPLLVELFTHYLNPVDIINACRGQVRRLLEFNGTITSKSMLHALRFALIAERVKRTGKVDLNLNTMVEGTVFETIVADLVEMRNSGNFDAPATVLPYLNRICYNTEWPEAEKFMVDDEWFSKLNLVYGHIVKTVCTRHELMCVSNLKWSV